MEHQDFPSEIGLHKSSRQPAPSMPSTNAQRRSRSASRLQTATGPKSSDNLGGINPSYLRQENQLAADWKPDKFFQARVTSQNVKPKADMGCPPQLSLEPLGFISDGWIFEGLLAIPDCFTCMTATVKDPCDCSSSHRTMARAEYVNRRGGSFSSGRGALKAGLPPQILQCKHCRRSLSRQTCNLRRQIRLSTGQQMF